MVSLQLLGALGLLIYGMKIMSDALQKMAGPQLKYIEGNLMQTPEIAVLQHKRKRHTSASACRRCSVWSTWCRQDSENKGRCALSII